MKLILLLMCLLKVFLTLRAAKTMGPVGNLIVTSLGVCKEKPPGDEIVLNAELKSIDGKGTKAVNVDVTLKIPIDNSIDFNLDVLKFENGAYKKFYNAKGKFCTDFIKLFGKLSLKLKGALKPAIPINPPCPIAAGSYSSRNFQASSKDLTIPAIFYGKFKIVLQLLKKKKVLACIEGEGISQAPA